MENPRRWASITTKISRWPPGSARRGCARRSLPIYRFARTADDIADEGDATRRSAARRPRRLPRRPAARSPPAGRRRRAGPRSSPRSRARSPRTACRCRCSPTCSTPSRRTPSRPATPTATELLDYCRRSANPIGRLLLHLYGIDDARSLAQLGRDLQRAPARQLLAGPRRRRRARPPLRAGGRRASARRRRSTPSWPGATASAVARAGRRARRAGRAS